MASCATDLCFEGFFRVVLVTSQANQKPESFEVYREPMFVWYKLGMDEMPEGLPHALPPAPWMIDLR
jgi:hypothetical protein